jgi:hypothetical protein
LIFAGCGSKPPAQSAAPAATPVKLPAAASAPAQSGKSTNALAELKSVFRIDARKCRDPFFPQLTRAAETSAVEAASIRLPLVSYLKLVGIRSGTARPMALINRSAMSPGEEVDVSIVVSNQTKKAEVRKVLVRCLEVRRDSVLITIAGEEGVKELRMAQRK